MHQQETTYWCGPASALQAIDYIIDNNVPSQQQLANEWDPTNNKYGMNTDLYHGTTSPDMARAMNHWIDTTWYVARAEDNYENLWAKLVFAVDYRHPANILVNTQTLSWYNGKELTHFLTVRGWHDWSSGEREVDLVDPNWNDTYFGYQNYEPYDNVYSAVNSQSWRENIVY
ncbi:C39 family peptidase [Metallumcola ferriviriculae]|uniref:C39 family peptidase n=1 Tax=Metallumcola ferriviriculae TaxID=3039180 RepID=A0AAU0UQ63_9FIRM|nr:C39 family peptidase [Desulfitibacteraceae bacterium MK1]